MLKSKGKKIVVPPLFHYFFMNALSVFIRSKKVRSRGEFETRPYPLEFGVKGDKFLFLTLGTFLSVLLFCKVFKFC